ncbi:MAG: preprotein translocase subunit YajC [Oscillospiraceae bacterium]
MDQILPLVIQLSPFLVLIPVFYFILIRPQRKKDKEAQTMRNTVQVGDEVVTVGGIVGIVVSIKEDTIVLETGSDRSKVRVKRWAIQTNATIHDDSSAAI